MGMTSCNGFRKRDATRPLLCLAGVSWDFYGEIFLSERKKAFSRIIWDKLLHLSRFERTRGEGYFYKAPSPLLYCLGVTHGGESVCLGSCSPHICGMHMWGSPELRFRINLHTDTAGRNDSEVKINATVG
jgi:hypothetical protein